MAVAFDAVTTKVGSNASFTHTPVGTPTLVIVSCHRRAANDGTSEITAISYGGEALTFHGYIDSKGNTSAGATGLVSVIEIWYLVDPSAGAQTVAVTAAGTNDVREVYVARTYTGIIDAGTPLGTVDTDYDHTSTTYNSCGATVSSETNGLVIDALMTEEAETHTVDSGQTERFQVTDSSTSRACGSTENGAASVTMGWSWSTVTRFAYMVVPINPGSGVPTAGGDPTLVGPPTEAQIYVGWTASPDATGCYVHRSETQGFTPSVGTRVSTDLGAAAELYGGVVAAETQYYYIVEWTNASGSTYSSELPAKTAHNRPTDIVFDTVTANSIEFTFTPGTGADDAYHRALVYEDGDFIRQVLLEPGDYNATVDGLKPGSEYTVKVQAYDAEVNDGVGAFSTLYSGSTFTVLRAVVTAFELETGNAPRQALVTAFELEVPQELRWAVVTAFELEVPDTTRHAVVTAFELQAPGEIRQAVVTAFELEVPNVGRVQSQPGYPAIAPFPVPQVSYSSENETEFRRRVEESLVDIARIIQHIYEELS